MNRFYRRIITPSAVDKALVVLLVVGVVLVASPAFAGVLSGVTSKINQFNMELVALGGAVVLFGFIKALLAYNVGAGNLAAAAVTIAVGVGIGAAPQIVGFFVSGVGG